MFRGKIKKAHIFFKIVLTGVKTGKIGDARGLDRVRALPLIACTPKFRLAVSVWKCQFRPEHIAAADVI